MQRALFLSVILVVRAGGMVAAQCKPTPGAPLDPNYTPTAPKRASVGSGLVVTGTKRGSDDCSPVPGATVEFWLAGPKGVVVIQNESGSAEYPCSDETVKEAFENARDALTALAASRTLPRKQKGSPDLRGCLPSSPEGPCLRIEPQTAPRLRGGRPTSRTGPRSPSCRSRPQRAASPTASR
jgi:hypothetical protein